MECSAKIVNGLVNGFVYVFFFYPPQAILWMFMRIYEFYEFYQRTQVMQELLILKTNVL